MKDEFDRKFGRGESTKPMLAVETSRGNADWVYFRSANTGFVIPLILTARRANQWDGLPELFQRLGDKLRRSRPRTSNAKG